MSRFLHLPTIHYENYIRNHYRTKEKPKTKFQPHYWKMIDDLTVPKGEKICELNFPVI